ncbi:MAG: hypothetical protein ALECFALPRED_005942 [Alectoria fallacina]|uniref:Uncharacterized protein n=1 Tax=Alectoria fallacina TaxID=1903189 RepID=A0A8H3G4H7_9LECA|nr:MAG: hypothetical protein ALECFALPRED_005942 [Alectoria fallacina]
MEGVEPPVELGGLTEYQPQPVPLYENRLSTPFIIRFPAATAGAFLTGAALGVSHGGKTAGMRFRAENSHRFPTTSAGWYLYHKSKNYHMMLGGIKEGLKMGTKVGFWAGSFFVVEEAVDELRGTKDFLSTVVAGMTIAAGFSGQPWNILPLDTAARTIRTGLYGGLAFGLAQDALGLARGRRLGYVDFLLGRSRDTLEVQDAEG